MNARRLPLESVLDLARWAPSGDNTQPWRFEITGNSAVTVHGFDTREHCVYDFAGRPSQLSLGALLETIAIAASGFGMRAEVLRRRPCSDATPTFDVRLLPDSGVKPSPLLESVTARTVQRRAMRMTPLTADDKVELESAAGAGYRVVWRESFAQRARIARCLFSNARIRLTMPEAYKVHRDVIEFGARFSADRIPDQAVGLDPLSTALMRWMMASWPRLRFFNRYLGGTLIPRLELDLIPGIACAAHFALRAPVPPSSLGDFIEAGRALQRFWLTATRLGLYLQPEMTPLVFSWYVRSGTRFSAEPALWDEANTVTARFDNALGTGTLHDAVFLGRIGRGPGPAARSLRLPLESLLSR